MRTLRSCLDCLSDLETLQKNEVNRPIFNISCTLRVTEGLLPRS